MLILQPLRRRFLLGMLAVAAALPSAAAEQSDDEVAFFRAAQLDNVSGVKKMLARGLNPNVRDPNGETGLIVAMRYEAVKVGNLLMDQPGIDLEAKAPNGNTALMMAAFRQNKAVVLDMIKQLRDKGLSIILISHNMPHVWEVADRIHIQRLGARAGVITPQSHDMGEGVAIMTGAKKLSPEEAG